MNYNKFYIGGDVMAKTIQVRVDDDLKLKSDKLFEELGTTTNDAIKMFLKKAIRTGGIPFEISLSSRFNETSLQSFAEVDAIKTGSVETKVYSNPDDLFSDLGI